MTDKDEEMKRLMEKYNQKMNQQFGESSFEEYNQKPITSIEYEKFKKERMPKILTLYEKTCNFCGNILKLKPGKEDEADIIESLRVAHIETTPEGVTSFSIFIPFLIVITGVLLSIVIPGIFGKPPSTFFIIIFIFVGLVMMFTLKSLPRFFADHYRLEASNEMVLSIFYIVTYMRHTSNLELAIRFASDHLTGQLALDLKKVLWDVETEKYGNIKESIDNYLETWRKWNMEYIEAFHLIESSLYETSEPRRIEMLEKSLNLILSETYEKMLHYAHNLKSPITMLHMLGIILPVLGLVMLPLIVSFMGNVKWYYIATLYNVILPIGVYYMGKNILSQRPTGYGDTDVSDEVPSLKKYKNINFKLGVVEYSINPVYLCIGIGVLFFLIALLPVMLHGVGFPDLGFGEEDKGTGCMKTFCLLDYREVKTEEETFVVGPFGFIASILSLFFPLAIAFSLGLYYKMSSQNIIKIREDTKKLENEFASGLFQLGNRLGDGIPAESAFGKVAEIMQNNEAGRFFSIVNQNIIKLGMDVESAIFNSKTGAIVSFPSQMINSSMKVLIQSVEKGPKIAAQSLVNVSRYIKEMHRVNERLKDLLADVISSMKSQISMMAPAIAGIVVGITSMIVNILGKLGPMLQAKQAESSGVAGAFQGVDFFNVGIPVYYFQLVVGIYVVQIIYILTILVNGIENGTDKLQENYLLGKNLIRSTMIYVGISLVVMIAFNLIANAVIGGVLGAG
ncbi:hypothetical protein HZA96_03220 [Candidatus Woesearchaeota archaeon]|nr:hypothetical protein [Candidatus Woesearchaeota archaeon]